MSLAIRMLFIVAFSTACGCGPSKEELAKKESERARDEVMAKSRELQRKNEEDSKKSQERIADAFDVKGRMQREGMANMEAELAKLPPQDRAAVQKLLPKLNPGNTLWTAKLDAGDFQALERPAVLAFFKMPLMAMTQRSGMDDYLNARTAKHALGSSEYDRARAKASREVDILNQLAPRELERLALVRIATTYDEARIENLFRTLAKFQMQPRSLTPEERELLKREPLTVRKITDLEAGRF